MPSSAPHAPWTPALQDAGSFDGVPIAMPGSAAMNDVSGAPGWVRTLPRVTGTDIETLTGQRRRMLETLRSVDRALAHLVEEIGARDELGRTLIVFLTDNGFSFGEHRWVGKRCHYDACIRVPLVMRAPWAEPGTVAAPVSIVDLAPTVLDLVGDRADVPPVPTDGLSLRPWLGDPAREEAERTGVLVRWAGDPEVPAWVGIRTREFAFFEHADGTIELYDVAGAIGVADPRQLRNRAGDRRYLDVES